MLKKKKNQKNSRTPECIQLCYRPQSKLVRSISTSNFQNCKMKVCVGGRDCGGVMGHTQHLDVTGQAHTTLHIPSSVFLLACLICPNKIAYIAQLSKRYQKVSFSPLYQANISRSHGQRLEGSSKSPLLGKYSLCPLTVF